MPSVAVVGAGPAGLMAADVLAGAGLEVTGDVRAKRPILIEPTHWRLWARNGG